MSKEAYNLKPALPNKMLNEDGSVTDLLGNPVVPTSEAYKNKPSLPNKVLNPDGTYSTLSEIIGGSAGKDLFIVVDELPAEGEPNKIYLVPDGEGGFDEYHYVDGKWDPIGTMGSDIPAQVYYWDGDTQQAGIDFWNNLLEINKSQSLIVFGGFMAGVETSVAYIRIGAINNATNSYIISFTAMSPEPDQSYLSYTVKKYTTKRYKLNKSGQIITRITSMSNIEINFSYLDINNARTNAFVPTQDWQPATKKYVDDAISNNITSALGGEY